LRYFAPLGRVHVHAPWKEATDCRLQASKEAFRLLGGSDGGELVAGGWWRGFVNAKVNVNGSCKFEKRKAEKSMGPGPSLHG